jgi:hypothetical protein
MIYCLLASLNLLPNSNDAYIQLSTIFSAVIGSTFIRALLPLAARKIALWEFSLLKSPHQGPEDDLNGFAEFVASKQYSNYKVHNIFNNKQ